MHDGSRPSLSLMMRAGVDGGGDVIVEIESYRLRCRCRVDRVGDGVRRLGDI